MIVEAHPDAYFSFDTLLLSEDSNRECDGVNRIPAMYPLGSSGAGGLIAYGSSISDSSNGQLPTFVESWTAKSGDLRSTSEKFEVSHQYEAAGYSADACG